MPKLKPGGTWLLQIATLLLTACGARQLEVRPADPLPPPEITAPETVTREVERPSWMEPAVLILLGPIGLPFALTT